MFWRDIVSPFVCPSVLPSLHPSPRHAPRKSATGHIYWPSWPCLASAIWCSQSASCWLLSSVPEHCFSVFVGFVFPYNQPFNSFAKNFVFFFLDCSGDEDHDKSLLCQVYHPHWNSKLPLLNCGYQQVSELNEWAFFSELWVSAGKWAKHMSSPSPNCGYQQVSELNNLISELSFLNCGLQWAIDKS